MAALVSDYNIQKKLEDSFAFCQQSAKDNSNFYMGIRISPLEKRKAVFAIYAWLHAVDDLADSTESLEKRLTHLDQFYEKTSAILDHPDDSVCDHYQEPYWLAFRHTVHQYQISRTYLLEMIRGQKQDLVKTHYETFAELYDYCRYVASSVGLMCITIWGYSDKKRAEKLAEECGVALQLTNILRDLQEDVQLKRVYLPLEFVAINEDQLTADNFNLVADEKLLNGINQMIERAKHYYDDARELYQYIHKDGRLSFIMLLESYFAIFNKICQNPKALLHSKKIKLTRYEKFSILAQVLFKHFRLYWRK